MVYEPLAYDAPGDVLLHDGGVRFDAKSYVFFEPLDDGTPGCVFDTPDFEPAAPCPIVEIRYRVELERRSP